MDKREFLKSAGLLGVASVIPFGKLFANGETKAPASCTLIPVETAGPFPLDLTANTAFFRQDIRETKTGVPINLRIRVIGDSNCWVMPNLRVNVWHCDKDGLYSGYGTENGLTYLRGYQYTDMNGDVEFVTIFPGWYPGRICHIHFQIYVSSTYAAISQLTFPIADKQAIYAANPSLYTNGADPTTLAVDSIFSDGYAFQMASLIPNTLTGGYYADLTVTIQGSGIIVGSGHIEKENAKKFVLGQNYPNPFSTETNIPLHLKTPSDVSIEIWDFSGRKLAVINKDSLAPGDHVIPIELHSLGLTPGSYMYQLEVRNVFGSFRQCKVMTGLQDR